MPWVVINTLYWQRVLISPKSLTQLDFRYYRFSQMLNWSFFCSLASRETITLSLELKGRARLLMAVQKAIDIFRRCRCSSIPGQRNGSWHHPPAYWRRMETGAETGLAFSLGHICCIRLWLYIVVIIVNEHLCNLCRWQRLAVDVMNKCDETMSPA